jgi:hypothetical protein
VHAQFQQHWVFQRTYSLLGDGTLENAATDSIGGVYLGINTRDVTCFYGLGSIDHIDAAGSIAWQSLLYIESPCQSQTFLGMVVAHKRIYFSGYDTASWIGQMDNQGGGVWRNDSAYGMQLGDFDSQARLSAFHYQMQVSSVFLMDTLGNAQWYYPMPYPFVHTIRKTQCDNSDNHLVFFEYTDNAQSEPAGIGVVQLDPAGNLIWDTLINPAATAGDPDLYVDAEVDAHNNSYILSRDQTAWGAFITKLDPSGNGVANSSYVTTPDFAPQQLAIDTLNGLVYVVGRDALDLIILKFSSSLVALDTMRFGINIPMNHVIAINESGHLLHSWMCDTGATSELRLELFSAAGLLMDTYTYWDSSFTSIIPHSIIFDQLGGIFLICNAGNTSGDDVGLVIKMSNPLSLAEHDLAGSQISIYPNPATARAEIQLPFSERCDIRIFNTAGKICSTGISTSGTYVLDVSILPSGLYFVEVLSETGQYATEKFIIHHP